MADEDEDLEPKPQKSPGDRTSVITLDGVQLDQRNPVNHPDGNRRRVSGSVAINGGMRSIVLDGNNNVLAGNCTVEEARKLREGGNEVIKRIVVIDAAPDELIAVRRADLTEAQAVAYKVADNASETGRTWNADNVAYARDVVLADPDLAEDWEAALCLDEEEITIICEEEEPASGGGRDSGKAGDPAGESKLGGLEYKIMVTCADEDEQAEILARLQEEGLDCKPLIL